MRILYIFALAVLLIFNVPTFKVNASENKAIQNKSQIVIANKYAKRFCSAKTDHFFEGLDNEKTLKYSYFRYIGLMSEEILSNEMYKLLIHQIKEECLISNEEEREINEFLLGKSYQK